MSTDSRERIWRIIGNQETNLKNLTDTLGQHVVDDDTRHQENIATLAEIENAVRDQGTKFQEGLRAQTAELAALSNNLMNLLPTMRRMRQREMFRRSIFQCLSRWKGIVTAAGVSLGALITWYGDHWPKIAAVLRKILGALLVLGVLALLASAGRG